MAHDALTELLADTAWSADDTLVLDLPPGTGSVVLTTLQKIFVDDVVVVMTLFESSLESTARSTELFRDNRVPVLRVVVNMCELTYPSYGDTYRLFPSEAVSEWLGATVLAELPFSLQFQEVPTPDDAISAFEALAESVSEAAATAWDVDAPDDTPDTRGDPPERWKKRVVERLTALASSETFAPVSDRDPTSVRRFLGGLTGRAPAEIDRFSVERRMPNDWPLTAMKP